MPIEILYLVGAAAFVLTLRSAISIVVALWISGVFNLTRRKNHRRFFNSINYYFKSNWTIIASGIGGGIIFVIMVLMAAKQ
jgi:hypothetical protein